MSKNVHSVTSKCSFYEVITVGVFMYQTNSDESIKSKPFGLVCFIFTKQSLFVDAFAVRTVDS